MAENKKSIRERFGEFHRANPRVMQLFEQEVRKHKREFPGKVIPHKALLESLRWKMRFKTTDPDFKINNNFFSYYPRLYVALNPKDRHLFNLRKLRSEDNGPFVVRDQKGQLTFY